MACEVSPERQPHHGVHSLVHERCVSKQRKPSGKARGTGDGGEPTYMPQVSNLSPCGMLASALWFEERGKIAELL
jgi:hypothetical protein